MIGLAGEDAHAGHAAVTSTDAAGFGYGAAAVEPAGIKQPWDRRERGMKEREPALVLEVMRLAVADHATCPLVGGDPDRTGSRAPSRNW